jgi:hypothetical protein
MNRNSVGIERVLRGADIKNITNITYIRSKSDLPTPIAGVITLSAGNYIFTGDIDLTGDRLVCSGIVALFGVSSETSYIRSTGLTGANPLIYSEYSLPMQNISLTADYAMHVNGDGIRNVAIDWLAVNFVDCARVGIVDNVTNFVYKFSAFLNSSDLEFTGTIGTIAIESSLLNGQTANTILKLPATLTVTRRFRIIYSSIITLAGETSINVDVGATIPTEGYILDTVSFSGGGTYLAGITSTSNKARFGNNTGITNTVVNGQMYMQNNGTATTISNTTDFFKVAGTTTASADNHKYAHANNRLTNEAIVSRKFLVQASLSFSAGANNVCEFGFYDSELSAVRTPSRTKSTANSAGRAENVSFMCVVEHQLNDYIEIHAKNTSASTNITVTDMNVLITEIS